MKKIIKSIMENEKEHVIYLRRELHKLAELSNKEYKTAEFIEKYLVMQGLETKRSFVTGVVSYLDAGKEKTVLLRADMDALPITELNDVEYKSQTEGVMHACGHDAHVAMLLCVAKIFAENRDKLNVNILFVFQPAEEMEGGAEAMLKEGILDGLNVVEAIGFHVTNDIPAGKIMIKPGALMASPDDFAVKIIGRGGHGSTPEKCLDPIPVAASIVPELNAITQKNIVKGENQVVQVCMFNAGTSDNIIPDFVEIKGTARSFLDEVRKEIAKLIENVIKEKCEEAGLKYEFEFNYRYPPLINDRNVAQKMEKVIKENMGDIVTTWEKPNMAGEDFAYFAKTIPAIFLFLGTGNEAKGIAAPLHSSQFSIDENGLVVGVGAYVCYILNAF